MSSREGECASERAAEPAIAELQRHLLPANLPELAGYEFGVAYRPCEDAGGDFYGFQQFADGRLGMVIADIAGHGAPAAVMMAALRGALAAFRVFGRPRETAAQDLNAMVCEINVPGMFITAFFIALDPASGTLYCGNCGHPPAIIGRADGRWERVNAASDLPLGIVPTVDPPMMTVNLGVGDFCMLYTDGVTDARTCDGQEFGEGLLVEALRAAPAESAQQTCDRIMSAIRRHEGGSSPLDDQCVVVFKRTHA